MAKQICVGSALNKRDPSPESGEGGWPYPAFNASGLVRARRVISLLIAET
jgi:hypothetical protein